MSLSSVVADVVKSVGKATRVVGQALDNLGSRIEVAKHTERLIPSTRFVSFGDKSPSVARAFVAPSANVIGDVTIGSGSSVWYGATVRGDVHYVKIGERTSIGDRAVVHVAKIQGDFPTIIGDGVTVGPGAMVHAATLGDGVVVGAGAQVLDGSTVRGPAVIMPGAVVTPGTVVPAGEVWGGTPAKMVRKMEDSEAEGAVALSRETMEMAAVHAEECAKTYEELYEDEQEYQDYCERDKNYFQKFTPDQKQSVDDFLGLGAPGEIFHSNIQNPTAEGPDQDKEPDGSATREDEQFKK
mmetsp:Transcript_41363/g.81023  ORF Transcript_41363/g.81023 Transcript_41363/m.81023 type:complete len:297 (-) Transcript_41363:80-970(-)